MIQGPFAYYVERERKKCKRRRVRKYMGKVPEYYIDLLSKEVRDFIRAGGLKTIRGE